MRLTGRVEKLEEAGKPARSLPLIVWHDGETKGQARQRWQEAHPEEDLDAAGPVIVVHLVRAKVA